MLCTLSEIEWCEENILVTSGMWCKVVGSDTEIFERLGAEWELSLGSVADLQSCLLMISKCSAHYY